MSSQALNQESPISPPGRRPACADTVHKYVHCSGGSHTKNDNQYRINIIHGASPSAYRHAHNNGINEHLKIYTLRYVIMCNGSNGVR